MKKTLVGLALISVLNLIGCEKPAQKGVITRESFYPATAGGSFFDHNKDRYSAIVQLSDGTKIGVSEIDSRARIADLRYNVGDTVSMQYGRIADLR